VTPGRSARRRLAVPAAALLALASVSCSAPAAPTAGTRPDRFGAAAAQPSAPALPITLVGQSAFVRAGGDFNLVVRISPPAAAGEVEAVASVFPAVPNRSAFVEALTEVPNRLPLGISSPAVPDSEGLVGIRLQLQDPALPRDAERVWMGRRNGVHPVVVEVRDRDAGPVRNRLITFLVHLAEADPPAPLLFGLGVPVHVPVGTAPEGVARDARLDGLVAGLDAAGSLPLTLVPTPRTLDTLASFEDPSSGTLARLQAAAQSRPVLAGPYVPIDVPSLLDRRLDREIERQFQRGRETTAAVLGHPPDATTWASDTSLTDAAVERLHREGITRMVVPERLLVPITRQVTLTSPFLLRGEQARVPTLAADDGLGAHLGQGDQALRAHQLLADLAVREDLDSTELVVSPGEAAAKAGVRDGDRVVRVDDTPVERWSDVRDLVEKAGKEGRALALQLERPGETPGAPPSQVRIEVEPEPQSIVTYGFGFMQARYVYRAGSLLEATRVGLYCSWSVVQDAWLILKRIALGQVSGDAVGGPIAIYTISYTLAAEGWAKLFFFLALLSMNLAFLNVLPIPVLDGGHLLFLLIEKLKGSPVSERVLGYSQVVGIALIVSLMVIVTFNDIKRVFFE